jgi:hypothetical protein
VKNWQKTVGIEEKVDISQLEKGEWIVDIRHNVQFKVQLDVPFMCIVYSTFSLSSTCFRYYLHPSSGAELQRTAIGMCMVLVF